MKFRPIIIPVIILSLLFAFSCTTRKNQIFSISGQIRNAPNQFLVLTQEEDINRKKSRVIARIPLDEKGKFEMTFETEPHIYNLFFDDNNKVTLAIDKGQNIVVRGNAKDYSTIRIEGSTDTNKLTAYEKFRKESLDRLVISVRNEIKSLQTANGSEMTQKLEELNKNEIKNYDKHTDELLNFAKENIGSSIALYGTSLRWNGNRKNIPVLETLAKEFKEKHPDLKVTQKIEEKIQVLKNTNIDGKVAEINLPDKEGKNTSLFPLKGKYTLIDFWASWCSPCRRESKNLQRIYEKHKDQGFEIYGVSLDDEKAKWLNAMEQDKRIWTNVSSLQGFETPITFDYAVTALPQKFIVDKEGRIVAKNLHGKELEEKIEALFSSEN